MFHPNVVLVTSARTFAQGLAQWSIFTCSERQTLFHSYHHIFLRYRDERMAYIERKSRGDRAWLRELLGFFGCGGCITLFFHVANVQPRKKSLTVSVFIFSTHACHTVHHLVKTKRPRSRNSTKEALKIVYNNRTSQRARKEVEDHSILPESCRCQ